GHARATAPARRHPRGARRGHRPAAAGRTPERHRPHHRGRGLAPRFPRDPQPRQPRRRPRPARGTGPHSRALRRGRCAPAPRRPGDHDRTLPFHPLQRSRRGGGRLVADLPARPRRAVRAHGGGDRCRADRADRTLRETRMNFVDKLRRRWRDADSLLCVGLDPDPARFPEALVDDPDALFDFCRDIVDATAEFACAFKPQIAYFAAHNGGEAALQRLVAHIDGAHPDVPVILDAKRGDIGSTAEHYAVEAFDRCGADAVTLNPYMGRDSAEPFLRRDDRGCIFLCHTSNPGARDFQELEVDGRPLYQHIARTIAQEWNASGNCALVVGATFPEELKVIRGIVGDMPLLIPGVGAQGGDVEAVVRHGASADGTGLMVNSSRGILYASSGAGYADAAAAAARRLRDAI